ncbi:MAG: glutamate-5-semialdehyde dehydrogenase [Rhodospirillales bacterium]
MTPSDKAKQADNVPELMREIGVKAKAAAGALAVAGTESKNKVLIKTAQFLRQDKDGILAANAKDMAGGEQKGLTPALMDRLALDDDRIESMAAGLEAIAELSDPVGQVMAEWERPNGLRISRVRVPLGVIGVIYESRPNVTADAGALCLKAGNAVILRGGSESFHSSAAIMASLAGGLKEAGLPGSAIQLVPTTDRAAVGEMLKMSDFIDVIVPRGGRSLIERITAESRIPMFKHLEGICHTYVDGTGDADMARDIVLNAKMRRTGVCGATETLLVKRSAAKTHLPSIVDALIGAGCEVRGDKDAMSLDDRVVAANDQDWDTEYLDAVISVRIVDGLDEAIDHISRHSSQHTEAIITEDAEAAETFLNRVDSAIVMVNASTQYADGGEFGMGAEIGISTGKLHARGPVGVEQLTSFKYMVRGSGQCRP